MGVQTRNPVVGSGLRRIAALVLAVGLAVPQAAWASCDPRGEVWGFSSHAPCRLGLCHGCRPAWVRATGRRLEWFLQAHCLQR